MQYAFRTDIGKRRRDNQDSVGVFHNHANALLAMVADGMGGHLGGDVASEMIVSNLGKKFEDNRSDSVKDLLKWLVFELNVENKQLLETASAHADLAGMGSTFVAALFLKDDYLVANIGDSRCYRLQQGRFKQLTEDHSFVNELVKHGEITPEEAKNHPPKNLITRSLGVSQDVDADVTMYHSEPGDYLLLCSDGLTNMVSDEQLQTIIQSRASLDEKCQEMIDLANNQGGRDNVTALLLYNDLGVTMP